MSTAAPPSPATTTPGRQAPARTALLIGVALVIALAVIVSAVACRSDNRSSRTGSGVAATNTRTVPPFAAIDLAGTNQVTVRVGGPRQVVVHADNNLLTAVTTEVVDGVLVVSDRGSFTTRSPMSVLVTVPSLAAATLSGTGQLTVTRVTTHVFTARLPGTGNLVVSGQAGRVDAALPGDGALELGSLLAQDVTVTVTGTGSATVYASRSLRARVSGTGAIVYRGNPASLTKTITGVGSISTE